MKHEPDRGLFPSGRPFARPAAPRAWPWRKARRTSCRGKNTGGVSAWAPTPACGCCSNQKKLCIVSMCCSWQGQRPAHLHAGRWECPSVPRTRPAAPQHRQHPDTHITHRGTSHRTAAEHATSPGPLSPAASPDPGSRCHPCLREPPWVAPGGCARLVRRERAGQDREREQGLAQQRDWLPSSANRRPPRAPIPASRAVQALGQLMPTRPHSRCRIELVHTQTSPTAKRS